jgi:membrane protein DedA with SNARE-associated domain
MLGTYVATLFGRADYDPVTSKTVLSVIVVALVVVAVVAYVLFVWEQRRDK